MSATGAPKRRGVVAYLQSTVRPLPLSAQLGAGEPGKVAVPHWPSFPIAPSTTSVA
jgi:hypothetical protein